jgi:hypothetical protein
MKNYIFIIPLAMIIFATLSVNTAFAKENPSDDISTFSIFEPGETVFVEIPAFDLDKITQIKSYLTASSQGVEWLGYCQSLSVICVKIPASGQIAMEDAFKQIIPGSYKIYAQNGVSYSLTDSCFITE